MTELDFATFRPQTARKVTGTHRHVIVRTCDEVFEIACAAYAITS